MNIREKKVELPQDEGVTLEYIRFTRDFEDIKDYIQNREENVPCYLDKELVQVHLSDILYFEAVKNLVFAYTEHQVYEMKQRLYQIEEQYRGRQFMRASKSVFLNVSQIVSVRPALNGRLYATMVNHEEIIISRQYGVEIKKYIMEGLSHA